MALIDPVRDPEVSSMISERLESLTYSTDGTQGLRIAFGAFVCLVALVPSTIVAVQALSRSGGTGPRTDPWSIVPGVMIALWGLWHVSWREHVIIDPHEKTITWRQSVGDIELRRIVWGWDEVAAIQIRNNNGGFKLQGYSAQVTGPRGTRELLSYLDSPRSLPEEIRETSRLLERPLELP